MLYMKNKIQTHLKNLLQANSSSQEISEEQLGHLLDVLFQEREQRSESEHGSRENDLVSISDHEVAINKTNILNELIELINEYMIANDQEMRLVALTSHQDFSKSIEHVLECRQQFHIFELKLR
jgi:hypothetical protein